MKCFPKDGECMRRNPYSVEQIIAIVRQHENGRSAKELCRKYGFSEQTLERWKSKDEGMPVAEAKRREALEAKNRRLEHVITEITVEKTLRRPRARTSGGLWTSCRTSSRMDGRGECSTSWTASCEGARASRSDARCPPRG